VKCPHAEVCRLGRCVDPCASITCDDGYSCWLGVCVDCDCAGCAAGESCVDNVCIEDACASVSCNSGTHCVEGRCVDDCEGAVCPGGAACRAGACEALAETGNGGGNVNSSDAGVVIASGGSSGIVVDGPKNDSAESGDEPESAPVIQGPDGCACHMRKRSSPLLAGALCAGIVAVFAARRRRAALCAQRASGSSCQ